MTTKSERYSYKWPLFVLMLLLIGGSLALTDASQKGAAPDMGQGTAADAVSPDIEAIIEGSLIKIVSNPNTQLSSNPYVYIEGSKTAYNEIIRLGQPALEYMLKKFHDSSKNGLEQWIMAKACCDILQDNNTVKSWGSGREWYEKFSNIKS